MEQGEGRERRERRQRQERASDVSEGARDGDRGWWAELGREERVNGGSDCSIRESECSLEAEQPLSVYHDIETYLSMG